MTTNEIKRPDPRKLDYNTERQHLRMPEYGRTIQEMVEYAKTLEDKQERQDCAATIVSLMAGMAEQRGDREEFEQKLWNHLAAIANYELDIDYPVAIIRLDEKQAQHERIPYPQKRIARRHYGAAVEATLKKIAETEDTDERIALTRLVAIQMKRDLGRWNRDAMNDQKVLNDIAQMTDGAVCPEPGSIHLPSDSMVLGDVQQMMPSKKKRRR